MHFRSYGSDNFGGTLVEETGSIIEKMRTIRSRA